jgi:hypothetical protein
MPGTRKKYWILTFVRMTNEENRTTFRFRPFSLSYFLPLPSDLCPPTSALCLLPSVFTLYTTCASSYIDLSMVGNSCRNPQTPENLIPEPRMKSLLIILGAIGAWFLLTQVVLPKLGLGGG